MLHGGRVHMRAVEGTQTSHLDVVPTARLARGGGSSTAFEEGVLSRRQA